MESVIKFESPCTCIIAGPTGSGKTTFLYDLLTNAEQMFMKPTQENLLLLWYSPGAV